MKLGTVLLQTGKSKQAEQELRKAVEIDPGCVPAWVNLGGILLARWDFKGCVEANREASKHKPDTLQAHYNEGLGHLYLVQKDEMVACFERVVELDPEHAGGHYHLAVGLLALGKKVEAKNMLTKAMQLGYKPEPEFLKALRKDDGKNKPATETESNIEKERKH